MVVPFQPGGEAHTLAALGWGDEAGRLHELVVPQPLDRQQLFDGLAPFVAWFTERFEAAWQAATWDADAARWHVDPAEAPQVVVPNPAALAALGRIGRRLSYLPTEPGDDPDAPPPAPVDLVRVGRTLRWLAGHASEPGQNLALDVVTLTQAHWVTVQSVSERAHLGALDAWVEPLPGVDPDTAADAAERRSIGPYAVPTDEHPITDTITSVGEASRAGRPTADLEATLQGQWHALVAPVWDITWRAVERLRALPAEERYLPERRDADAAAYARQMAWLDGPTGGRTRTRDTPRQAIRAKKMAEYRQAVVDAQERVTDPLAMVDEILAGKAVAGTVTAVDATRKEVRPGNTRATLTPVVTLRCDRPCRVPLGRELWWTQDCSRVKVVLDAVRPGPGGTTCVDLKVWAGMKDATPALAAIATASGTACFSVYTTKQYFPSKLPPGDPFTHREPTQSFGHLEDVGGAA